MMKDGFESKLASWILFPEALPIIAFYRLNNMLKSRLYLKNIGAIKFLNQNKSEPLHL
jgi:hypothetical protein